MARDPHGAAVRRDADDFDAGGRRREGDARHATGGGERKGE
jgi:hypothetical protein